MTTEPKKENLWGMLGIGVLLALIALLFFAKRLFCFYAYDPSAELFLGALTGIGALIAAVTKFMGESLPLGKFKKILWVVLGFLSTLIVVIFLSPFFLTLEKKTCVTDYDELLQLIQLEEKAVQHGDIGLIEEIYTADAIVFNAETEELFPAYLYYSQKFAREVHCTTSHFDFQVERYTRDQKEVVLTTGSRSSWGVKETGCTNPFYNPAGGDQWHFVKTEKGWKISHFSFNNLIEKP